MFGIEHDWYQIPEKKHVGLDINSHLKYIGIIGLRIFLLSAIIGQAFCIRVEFVLG